MRLAASARPPRGHQGPEAKRLLKCSIKSAASSRGQQYVEACDRPERRAVSRTPETNFSRPSQQRTSQPRIKSGPPSRHGGSRQVEFRGGHPPPASVDIASVKKRLVAAPSNDQLPRLDALIIVEGVNDCNAIHRVVRSPVYVLGGGYALAEEMKPELRYVAELAAAGQLPRQIVVFMDPDWQGRMFRTYLDDLLAQGQQQQQPQQQRPGAEARGAAAGKGLVVRHAFLRVELGTSDVDTRYHEAGNVGVEHASPDTVRACLVRARPGFGPARTEFSVEQLRADGLVGSWDDKSQVMGPQLRRGRFCAALGIDEVGTGKALVNLLNRFFTREEYESALKVAAGPAS